MTHSARKSGFALISVLSIMLLVVLLTVAMLSLTASATRSQADGKAQAEAQANAKLALMLAIGDLQKQMGPDQRISANGEILGDPAATGPSVNHPHWTGVWDSWIAGDLSSAQVNDNYPSVASHHQTIGSQTDDSMHPDYDAKDRHFRKWLLSLDPTQAASITSANNLSLAGKLIPAGSDTAVRLVGAGSLGDANGADKDYVSAGLLSLSPPKDPARATGRYAWWVGDQSQKAKLMSDSYDADSSSLTDAEKVFRLHAPGSMGNKNAPGLKSVLDETQLDKLPTLNTIDLIGLEFPPGDDEPRVSELNFHASTIFSRSVIADVREGGLKRDLSTLLERPIDLSEDGEEFMLYAFDDPRFPYLNNPHDDNRANSRVPIQDLAAYYQLYDNDPAYANDRRGGVHYSSTTLSNSLQINVPDHDGGSKDRQRLIREYTSLYRRPVVTKVQFLVGVNAQPITQAERDWVKGVVDGTINWGHNLDDTRRGWGDNMKYLRDSDTLKLKLGVQPMVTLWNPSNLPLVMEANQILRYNVPPFGIKFRKYRAGGDDYESLWMNLGYANNPGNGTSNGQAGGNLLDLRLANNTVVFEPGEVKVFSIPETVAAYLTDGGDNEGNTLDYGRQNMDVVNEWDPFGVFLMKNSAPVGHYAVETPDVYCFDNNGQRAQTLVLSPDDRITISVDSETAQTALNRANGRNASRDAEIKGAGFGLYIFDEGYKLGHWSTWADALRHDIMISRHGSQTNENRAALGEFYRELMLPGFPGGEAPIDFDNETNAIPGTQLEAAGENGEIIALMDFSLSIGCESSNTASGGFGGGRRVTSRPFLHTATAALPFISRSDRPSLYDYGLDWQMSKINTVEDSIIQAKPGTGNGYYGGGYTVELGATQVVQSHLPVLPPISMASLSHAHLGGFSLAKAIPVGEDPDTETYWFKSGPVKDPTGVSFQRTTASGQNGLAPHIVQAIGNSYAHPNIPSDKAFTTKTRIFDMDEGAFDTPFVDHSYLANKALWDDYFFSSIAPQPAKVPLYESSGLTAQQVANEFFFGDGDLPNRRLTPFMDNLDQGALDELFTLAGAYSEGLADKIASHLMVDGALNINTTSVDAWKVFLSSLKGKPVAYLDNGFPATASLEGTVVGPGGMLNEVPVKSSEILGTNQPPTQWMTGRELTDDEIDELAKAIVKQVKLRGPFLSLSEFINRQLDSSNPEFATKGALQAALDDVDVSINAMFRQSGRILDAETATISGFEFPDAAEGPVAYGSAPYVDQADVLRHLSEQITPRGDTFVIRSYGDSLDANGNVVARAWCEAVVQRVPEYCDTEDQPHEKQSQLSDVNKAFGRKFQIVSFRWLDANEI